MHQKAVTQMQPGDWICGMCGDIQFRRNPKCRKCGNDRPGGVPGQPGAAGTGEQSGIEGPAQKRARFEASPTDGTAGGLAFPGKGPGGMGFGTFPTRFAQQMEDMRQQQFAITANQKGALIGRGGQTINQIRADSGADVKVTHEEGEANALITIRGSSSQVQVAEALIQERLASTGPDNVWRSIVVEVPKDCIGETIGHAGCNLQAISEKSGCKVKFVQAQELDPAAEPGKQVCLIRGPPGQVDIAEALVSERVMEVQQGHIAKQLRAAEHRKETVVGVKSSGPAGLGTSTVPCKFHMRKAGTCKNGDQCWFSHDATLIAAAQGESDEAIAMMSASPDYKMTYCKFFDAGRCTRGKACVFAHGVEDLRGGLTPKNMQIMEEARLLAEQVANGTSGAGEGPQNGKGRWKGSGWGDGAWGQGKWGGDWGFGDDGWGQFEQMAQWMFGSWGPGDWGAGDWGGPWGGSGGWHCGGKGKGSKMALGEAPQKGVPAAFKTNAFQEKLAPHGFA